MTVVLYSIFRIKIRIGFNIVINSQVTEPQHG
jgi:hypothetical protein